MSFSVGPNTISEAIARQQQQQSHSDVQQMNQPNGQNILCGDMSNTPRYPPTVSEYQSSGVNILIV